MTTTRTRPRHGTGRVEPAQERGVRGGELGPDLAEGDQHVAAGGTAQIGHGG